MSSLYLSDCTINHHFQWHQSLLSFELENLMQGLSSDTLLTRTDVDRLLMDIRWLAGIKKAPISKLTMTMFAFIIMNRTVVHL